jgi:DNA-binding phage protein
MTAKRVLISIDERLLERIDQACARRGMTRSAYLARLADADLSGTIGPGAEPSVRAALEALDTLLARREP